MIHGIGTDLVSIVRMEALVHRFGDRAARRILAGSEWVDYDRTRSKGRFLAKRFAAKEALAKALGTGLRGAVSLGNIAVGHDDLGRPRYELADELAAWMQSSGLVRTHLSLSDERDHALAFALVETE